MDNKYKLDILPLAKKDLDNIVYYISFKLNNKTAAKTFVKRFNEVIDNINAFSYGIPPYNIKVKLENEYRCIRINKYLLFYTINENKHIISIVRVLYKKMNFDYILK